MALSLERSRRLAETGYIFLFPLVRNYVVMYLEAVAAASPGHLGGFGRWARHRVTDSYEQDTGTSHAISLHSWMWLDVQDEPLAVSVLSPPGGSVTRITDLWGFVVAEHESRSDRAEWSVVVAAPGWSGSISEAEDVLVVRGESSFLRCETWSRPAEPIDADTSPPYRVDTLRTGTGPVPAAPPGPIEWWPASTGTEADLEFWAVASFALTLVTPHPDDAAMLDSLSEIGVSVGQRWDASDLEPDLLDAIGQGMDAALSELARRSAHAPAWSHSPRRPLTERDLMCRAVAALSVGTDLPVAGRWSSRT